VNLKINVAFHVTLPHQLVYKQLILQHFFSGLKIFRDIWVYYFFLYCFVFFGTLFFSQIALSFFISIKKSTCSRQRPINCGDPKRRIQKRDVLFAHHLGVYQDDVQESLAFKNIIVSKNT
jgi:hypothetical protein